MKQILILTLVCFSFHSIAQNVGINKPNPDTKLHVGGDATVDSILNITRLQIKDLFGDPVFEMDKSKFSWTPKLIEPGFHNFTVQIQDDGCPILGSQIFNFDICIPNKSATFRANGNELKFDLNAPDGPGISLEGGKTNFTWGPISGGLASGLIARDTLTQDSLLFNWKPNLGWFEFSGLENRGGFQMRIPTDLDTAGLSLPSFRLFGRHGAGTQFVVIDTIPTLLGTASDLLIKLEQDKKQLTVSNIGSSGQDGVSFEVGESGKPAIELFAEDDQGDPLLDFLLELDSQVKDGIIRVTDRVTGEVIEVGLDPNHGKVGIQGDDQNGFTFEVPNGQPNSAEAPTFRLFGENGEGARLIVSDTVPPIGIANDINIKLDQDKKQVTVSNIGSSGEDGVTIDLGEAGKPGFGIYTEDDQGDVLLDLALELDSQVKDGKIRTTDPITGEVLVIGIDPNLGNYTLDAGDENGFSFELPTGQPNSTDAPTFRLYGENGEGAKFIVTDTIPPVGLARDLNIRLNQDGKTLTIDNIGSSGHDGVTVDLGNEGKPGFGIFAEDDQGNALLDLALEIDSQVKDGKIRTTDPITGEVLVIGIDPNLGNYTLDAGDQNQFTFELPTGQPNSSDVPKFKLHGEHGEGAQIWVTDTVPPVGPPNDLKLEFDQDNGRLTVGNIGSSGQDGVTVDLGEPTIPILEWLGPNSSARGILDTSGIFVFESDAGPNKVQMAMIPNNNAIEFFAGNQPGNPPINVVVHGDQLVMGALQVQGPKNFKIDHPLDPENKYLVHSCIESPDMMNIYNGNITTDQEGRAIVQLPDYFEALNIDFRYQLTVIGAFAQAIIQSEVQDNQFIIATSEPNVKVSWQVTGIRNDAYARDHRSQVEIKKEVSNIGSLMYQGQE